MTNTAKILTTIALVAASLSLTPSCSRFRTSDAPSTEFATFIKAYTGGVISDKSSIRIQFTSEIPDAQEGNQVKDELFSFSPAVKGDARWISSDMIEFVPQQGALKSGQTYRGSIRLDKLMKVGNRKMKRFPFSFMVAVKEADIEVDEIVIPASAPSTAIVSGHIALSDVLELEQVKTMVTAEYPGDSSFVDVIAGSDPTHFRFTVGGLARAEKDRTLKIALKPGNTGFTSRHTTQVVIPEEGAFRVLSSRLVEGKDPYICIQFTQPLTDVADNNGLITLSGVGRQYIQTADNIARIYYEGKQEGPVTLTVSDALTCTSGNRLGQEYNAEFNTDAIKPAVTIPLQGNILPDSRQLILPFKAVGLSAVDLRVIKIYENNVLAFLQDNTLSSESSLRRSGRLVYKRCIRLDTDPSKDLSKWQEFSVDLSGLFKQEPGAIYRIRLSFKQDYSLYGSDKAFGGKTASGKMVDLSVGDMTEDDIRVWDSPYPYYYDSDYDWDSYRWEDRDNPLTPSYYMVSERFPECNLMTTHLGITAKYAGGDMIWLSANDILTSKPVYGVDFEVYNYQLQVIGTGKTDSEGLEEIKVSGKPFAVVARRAGATSYLKVTDGEEKSLSRFDVGGKALQKGLKSYIYGERGVWRPGDTLHVTMIVSSKDEPLPDSHPAVMELYTPQGQFYGKQICGKALNGFYTYHVPTRAGDPTGIWNAYFKVGGATFHKSLRIESIKPNRLKINLDMGSKILQAGGKTPVSVSASWLTGPAASGLATTATMTLSPGGTFFDGFKGYVFTDPTAKFTRSEQSILNAKLDAGGKATLTVPMPVASDAPGMLSADIVCSVLEQGGDASFTTQTLPFSPFPAYVGIKMPQEGGDGTWLETDKDQHFKVAVVDCNGKRVKGHNLEYRIYKMKWSWWWESRAEELDSYVNGTGSEAVASGRIVSGASDNDIPFRVDYPDWGRYLIYVKDLDGGHACGGTFLVDWPAYRGRSAKTDPDALSMLTFSLDKESYEVGETATVFIPGSAKGRALVSLENATTVLARAWVDTRAGEDTRYSFKVTPEMAPNFYVHITLLQPHSHADNDLPVRLYGVQPVQVENKASHLSPVITLPAAVHPEETFTVKVNEQSGKPMTYTLAIVDEGLLDLTSFPTPDPWKAFYAREALGVKTWDLYDAVIGAYSGRFSPMFSIGGDESILIRPKKDNRFNPVVKYMGPFTLSSGSNSHQITLPMYIGSIRVMVVAGNKGAFGHAEKTIPVRSPLMVLSTLPRVLAEGESIQMPVNVFALEDDVKSASVSIKAEGPVKITGHSQTSVAFASPGDKLVRFPLEATGEGSAKITVTAKGGSHTATETITVPVRNPHPPVVTLKRATLDKEGSASLAYQAVGKEAKADLELTSFPAIHFDALFHFMDNYQYTCSEQIASKGITLLNIMDMLSEENAAKARNMIPGLLQELYTRQLADGGFAYWPGQSASDEWVSSMAGQFLIQASGKGFDVGGGVLAGWAKFQNRCALNFRQSDNRFLSDLQQAYRLYTLVLASKADNASMNRLKEKEHLSPQARTVLAGAYAAAGKKAIAKEMLGAGEQVFNDYPASNMTFGSSLRDKAMTVEALTLTDEIPAALDLAQEVAAAFANGSYSTQEAAFAASAMNRLAGKANTGALRADITLDGKTSQVGSPKTVYTQALPTGEGQVTVKNHSDGTVYASVIARGQVPAGEKVPAGANGLRLNVNYVTRTGTPVNPASLKQGTEFTAVIQVTSTSLAQDETSLALCAAIPSGWEMSPVAGAAVPASQNSFTYNDIRDDRSIWYFDLARGTSKTFKLHLRAAYEGTFVLPSITCESMYDARVYARTASSSVIVTR